VEVVVIASGSSGNSALIRSGEVSLLVDVGVSALQIRKRLEVFGRPEGELTAILLTHEHSDHVRGLEVLLKRRAVPVWATAGTWSGVETRAGAGGELSSGRSLEFGQLRVTSVATSHDAREPVALLVDDGRHRIGFCTDTGVFTSLLLQRMAGCNALFIEANHDADMLRNGPYPWPLKQRIRSRLGHLGNHQTAEAVTELRSPGLRAVVGLHLSAENNRPEMVLDELHRCVDGRVPVHVVPRTDMLRVTLDEGITFEQKPVPPPRGATRRR
jgi:phosphoribosyl 1,2-cyclic phosphodiesterase